MSIKGGQGRDPEDLKKDAYIMMLLIGVSVGAVLIGWLILG